MDRSAVAIHVAICLAVGGVAWWFSGVNWLAATFWCSAVLYLTGSMAYAEDSEPGGFDNPDGRRERLGSAHAITSIAVTAALAGTGFAIQYWLGNVAG